MTVDNGAMASPKKSEKDPLGLPSQVDPAIAERLIEQAKYLIRIDALQANFGDLWISKKTLESLPPDVQQIMLDAGRDVEW